MSLLDFRTPTTNLFYTGAFYGSAIRAAPKARMTGATPSSLATTSASQASETCWSSECSAIACQGISPMDGNLCDAPLYGATDTHSNTATLGDDSCPCNSYTCKVGGFCNPSPWPNGNGGWPF